MGYITGGRFELLIRYSNLRTSDNVKANATELDNGIWLRLESANMAHDDACFQSLVEAGTRGLSYKALVEGGLAKAQLDALIKANIIAVHPGKQCTFHSRYVERYCQKAPPARLPHGARCTDSTGDIIATAGTTTAAELQLE